MALAISPYRSADRAALTAPGRKRSQRQRGNNVIEFSLLIPWYIFLFVGVYDYGFFSYSLISVQSAAAVGAKYAASSSGNTTDSTTVCGYALNQLKYLPNMGSRATCTVNSTTVSSAAPLAAKAESISSGPDGNPAAQVTVTYLTPQLVPIPGILPGQLTITRVVKMRVRS